jgi:ATP-binding cassette subfamily G (WHITE) protein 2 (PDR)
MLTKVDGLCSPLSPSTLSEDAQLATTISTATGHDFVQEFAREYIHNPTSNADNYEGRPIFGSNDLNSALNPRSDKFEAHAWAANVAQVAHEHGQSYRSVGLCFQNLKVFGYSTTTDFQKNVGNIWLAFPGIVRRFFSSTAGHTRVNILHQLEGIIRPGEMCVVLGPPGSGCSTFLKTVSGETSGIHVGQDSYFNYQGLSANEMHTAHRGDAIYTAEVDVHFPQLTVGETLSFASRARCQKLLPQGMNRDEYVLPFFTFSYE